MGQVFLARHQWLDVPVAIKIMNPVQGNDPESVDRFRRESRLAALLNHPNIVRATDGGAIEKSLYLVTEYLDGVDLKRFVDQNGPLGFKHACWIALEVAKAIDHAHAQGMVHRDIKPSNIMLLSDGTIKLLDLGLARYADSQTQMTSTGQFMGTIDYVSPEQAADTRNVDHRSDIYSLGCTLYYLLAGRPPFDGAAYVSIVSKILAHTEEAPPSVKQYCKNIPSQVVHALDKMMAKHPDDRFASAADVVTILSRYAEPVGGNRRQAEVAESQLAGEPDAIVQAMNKTGKGLLWAAWMVVRTLLSVLGVVERVEVGVSRLGGKKQFAWQFSPKGIVVIAVLGFIIGMIFFSGEFVVIEHSPY